MARRMPVFTSLAGDRSGWLRGDLTPGLTVWAVLVPEALAYASIAGVSPVVGLYTAPGALIFYAAFGSSKHLVGGRWRPRRRCRQPRWGTWQQESPACPSARADMACQPLSSGLAAVLAAATAVRR